MARNSMVTKIAKYRKVYYLTDSKKGGDLGGYFETMAEAKRALVRDKKKMPLFDRRYTKKKGRYYLKK